MTEHNLSLRVSIEFSSQIMNQSYIINKLTIQFHKGSKLEEGLWVFHILIS